MMRPSRLRLPASLFAAITAQQGIKSAPANLRRNCNAKINNSIRLLSMGAVRIICRSEETQSLKRSFHNASDEDDSSALGPLAGKGETELRKLVTEKPDLYKKRNPTRKALSGSSLPAKRSKEIIFPYPEIEKQKNVYRFDINNKCSSNIRKPNSVCIKNVPSVLGLSQGSDHKNQQHQLRATDSAIHSVCKSYGALEGLSRTKVDAVDALFSMEDDTETHSMPRRVGFGSRIETSHFRKSDTVVHGHNWSADSHLTGSKLEEIIKHSIGKCSLSKPHEGGVLGVSP
ncbi:hypothetical protein FEM48_Zijuj09G0014700 [Ziziphus jujuba var. spinosa]|uniref:Uncharacterized protein n=1 Tax=Ziziphus jujuba var. spinosa TaxID=714518 RepID=A0A978UQ41_ZIZJJ|nr:hypothetical protein FEM48_Zijuj09G0014700 [Ziziphus jujuba var. spinosa]